MMPDTSWPPKDALTKWSAHPPAPCGRECRRVLSREQHRALSWDVMPDPHSASTSSGGALVETVQERAHHAVMTDMESRYNRESGRLPSRLLSCEFFDNAITALCRQMLATRGRALHHKQGIEMHYLYDPPTHEFPNDELQVRHAAHMPPAPVRQPNTRASQFIVIFDKGPGMNKHELKGWAEVQPARSRP